MKMIDAILAELDQEARTTRKFLEALPEDQMEFKPHEKSMTTGKLAMHVATIPGHLAEWAAVDTFDMSKVSSPSAGTPSRAEILSSFEQSLEKCRSILSGFDDAKCMAMWSAQMNGQPLMTMPRSAMVRFWIMNHLYHHRGQLGVYLRLMGARVPSSYGPSADENPMAEMMAARN